MYLPVPRFVRTLAPLLSFKLRRPDPQPSEPEVAVPAPEVRLKGKRVEDLLDYCRLQLPPKNFAHVLLRRDNEVPWIKIDSLLKDLDDDGFYKLYTIVVEEICRSFSINREPAFEMLRLGGFNPRIFRPTPAAV